MSCKFARQCKIYKFPRGHTVLPDTCGGRDKHPRPQSPRHRYVIPARPPNVEHKSAPMTILRNNVSSRTLNPTIRYHSDYIAITQRIQNISFGVTPSNPYRSGPNLVHITCTGRGATTLGKIWSRSAKSGGKMGGSDVSDEATFYRAMLCVERTVLSVCLPICLSHAGILSKLLNTSSILFHQSPPGSHIILVFPYKTVRTIPTGTHLTGTSNAGCRTIAIFHQYLALSRKWYKFET